MANSSENKEKPVHHTTSVREVDDVAEDQTIVPDDPPPSSSQTPAASQTSSSRRRRSRDDKDREKATNKRRETVFDAPEVPRPCAVCGKQFFSYKALFGHMRSHPGREWRGAFPPPVTSPPREDRLVETLLKIGTEILSTAPPNQQAAVAEGSGRRLDIDLNREPPPSSPVSEDNRFDLNKDASGGSCSESEAS